MDKTSNPILYKYQDTTGTYQQVKVTTSLLSVKTNFACSGPVEYTGSANLPTRIDLPNGQFYTIGYEPTPSHSGYYTARVQRVTLPTGGYYEYDYGSTHDGINCADGTILAVNRVLNDKTNTNTWNYVRSPATTTTVTAPILTNETTGDQTVLTFDTTGHETSRKNYQGNATGGTLLRTTNTTWASGAPATRITILQDSSTQTEGETSYDSNGNLLSLKEHDWGTGAPGSVLRTTTLTYLSSSGYIAANILNRVITKTVADSTGTIKFRQVTNYDEGGSFTGGNCITGATQHNDTSFGCSFTARGNPTSAIIYTDPVTPAGGITKNFTYDSLGNLRTAQVDCCQQKQWNYSVTTNYAFPYSVQSGSASPYLTTSATYNAYTGQVATSSDENTKQTSYAYDVMKRLATVTRPDSAQITYAYDDTNLTATVTTPITSTSAQKQKTYLDGLGRAIKTSVLDTSSTSYSITETQYDAWGRPYKVSNPHNSTANYWTTNLFDALGRPVSTQTPDGLSTTYSYSTNTATVTDSTGKKRKTQADAMGRLSSVYEPDPANGNSLTLQTSYTYTVLDRLATVTQGVGVQTRTYAYDAVGRLTSVKTPETNQAAFLYQYNNFDLVTQRTDARGVITTYGYDTLNRPTGISYNVGSTGVAATLSIGFSYGTDNTQNNVGRLLTMTDGVGSESYSYDTNLPLTTQVQKVISGTTYTTNYAYNLAGELTQGTYPSGRAVQQSYDAIGRLCEIAPSTTGCGTATAPYATAYGFNTAFQVTGFNYGNGVSTALAYSADRLQLTSLAYAKGSTTLFSLGYGYSQNSGNDGEITSITDSVDSGRSATYTYDALGRVSTAVTTGSTNYPKWGLSWTYDRYGNRTGQSILSGCVAPMTCPTNSVTIDVTTNRLSGTPYAYDANGNMTNDGSNTLTYDAENHLLTSTGGAGSGTYTYDGKGIRVKKVSGSTTTVYVFSGTKVIAEYVNGAAPTAPTREYIYSGSQMIAKIEGGVTNYYHSDHLSARVTTDSTGALAGQQGHFPFGESWYSANTTMKFQFTSYERDAESGNDYAMARFNVNRLGRFSSPDPLPGNLSNPQSLNRYDYVVNDPIDFVDPLGLYGFSVGNCFFNLLIFSVDGQFDSAEVDFIGCIEDPPEDNRGFFQRVVTPIKKAATVVKAAVKAVVAVCSHVPDAASVGAGADVGLGIAPGGQVNLTANGASGELTLSLSTGISGGVIGPDAYVSASITPNAPDNGFLDTHGQPSVSYNAGVGRVGFSGGGGTYGGTFGPSLLQFPTGSASLMASKPLINLPYLGFLAHPVRATCLAVTGH